MAYFLPINSASLAHYFGCACVKPARYFDNKPQDIQDRFRNFILLSTEIGTSDTDCSIELVLTEDEEMMLIPIEGKFFLLQLPLPISRIKSIFFRNQHQMEQTLANINMSAAFVPCSLAKMWNFSDTRLDVTCVEDSLGDKDFAHTIELYDRILGALALMKTAKEPYMNYSENYASTLSFFNTLVKNDLERQGHKINSKFFGLFSRTSNFVKYIPYLEKRISKEDLDQIAADYNQKIERTISKVINFDKLSGITYAFAILQSYGVGDEAATKRIDGLISTGFEGLKDDMAEGIALYYGYNRGYSVFSNSYGTTDTCRQVVKYPLDSQLDYYTIESVYQFAFHKIISSSFPYIDAWCPKKEKSAKRKKDYMVLDTRFVGKKKPSVFSEEYLHGFLEEIKTLDFLNIPFASLIDHIRIRIATDTKEEFEDITETKVAEEQTKNKSLKDHIESQDCVIFDLQKQNDSLVEEIASLKSTLGQYTTKIEEMARLLQEHETESGSEFRDGEQNDSSGDVVKMDSVSIAVDGHTSAKKSKTASKKKSENTKLKTTSRSSKKGSNNVLIEEATNGAAETQVPAQDILTTSSFENGGDPTLFEQNE